MLQPLLPRELVPASTLVPPPTLHYTISKGNIHVRYESFSKLSDLKKKRKKQKMNAKEGCSGEEKEKSRKGCH